MAATLLHLEYIEVVWSRRGNTRLLLSEGTGQVDVEGRLDSLNSLYLIRPLTTELQLANHCVWEGGKMGEMGEVNVGREGGRGERCGCGKEGKCEKEGGDMG